MAGCQQSRRWWQEVSAKSEEEMKTFELLFDMMCILGGTGDYFFFFKLFVSKNNKKEI